MVLSPAVGRGCWVNRRNCRTKNRCPKTTSCCRTTRTSYRCPRSRWHHPRRSRPRHPIGTMMRGMARTLVPAQWPRATTGRGQVVGCRCRAGRGCVRRAVGRVYADAPFNHGWGCFALSRMSRRRYGRQSFVQLPTFGVEARFFNVQALAFSQTLDVRFVVLLVAPLAVLLVAPSGKGQCGEQQAAEQEDFDVHMVLSPAVGRGWWAKSQAKFGDWRGCRGLLWVGAVCFLPL